MEKMEKVLNAVNEAKKSSFWIRRIEKVSFKNFLGSYEEDNNFKVQSLVNMKERFS